MYHIDKNCSFKFLIFYLRYKHNLFPVLITLSCNPGTAILREEISLNIITGTTYLSKLSRELEETNRSQHPENESECPGKYESTSENRSIPPMLKFRSTLCQVTQRLPHSVWPVALQLYSD